MYPHISNLRPGSRRRAPGISRADCGLKRELLTSSPGGLVLPYPFVHRGVLTFSWAQIFPAAVTFSAGGIWGNVVAHPFLKYEIRTESRCSSGVGDQLAVQSQMTLHSMGDVEMVSNASAGFRAEPCSQLGIVGKLADGSGKRGR